jgi:hypothetical protein
MELDLSPRATGIAAICVVLYFAVAVSLPFVGRVLLRRDPRSSLGKRFVMLGNDMGGLAKDVAPHLPPHFRKVLESIPEVTIEVPAGVRVTVKSEPPKKDPNATPITRDRVKP